MGRSTSLCCSVILTLMLSWLSGETANVTVTIEPPFVQRSQASFDYMGVETFNSVSRGVHQTFVTTFENTPGISGTYQNVEALRRDNFGGAEGTGNYPVARSTRPYSINLQQTGEKGVNYFGYWLSALDPGNQLELYFENEIIFRLVPQDVLNLVSGNNNYFGNPTFSPRVNMGEPYVFINFFCNGCQFDRIVFRQTTNAGYESDNHTVGYFKEQSGTVVPTAAPTLPPTPAPTVPPTLAPTLPPTPAPTLPPTAPPTPAPTLPPTAPPTPAPTLPPTAPPTLAPTLPPTAPPTLAPTLPPTAAPTLPPTLAPTAPPTLAPTLPPTAAPTLPPTAAPTPPPTAAPTPPPTLATVPPTIPSDKKTLPPKEETTEAGGGLGTGAVVGIGAAGAAGVAGIVGGAYAYFKPPTPTPQAEGMFENPDENFMPEDEREQIAAVEMI